MFGASLYVLLKKRADDFVRGINDSLTNFSGADFWNAKSGLLTETTTINAKTSLSSSISRAIRTKVKKLAGVGDVPFPGRATITSADIKTRLLVVGVPTGLSLKTRKHLCRLAREARKHDVFVRYVKVKG